MFRPPYAKTFWPEPMPEAAVKVAGKVAPPSLIAPYKSIQPELDV